MATSKKAPSPPSYQALNEELEVILADLQRDDTNIDAVIKQYERGLELVRQLQQHLENTENTVATLKAKFNTAA